MLSGFGNPTFLTDLPAAFVGDLPCADCEGIRYRLELFPDGRFYLRATYLGRGPEAYDDDSGRWEVSPDERTLSLEGDGDKPLRFAIQDAERLTKLDIDGAPIESDLNYDLVRRSDPPPLVEGPENTYWKLMQLGGRSVAVAEGQREPHFILRPDSGSQRVVGSGGCNRLMGSYELAGETLTFAHLATTRKACAQNMETEAAFVAALGEVRTWRILGEHLELSDDDGTVLMRLEQRLF